MKLERVIAVKNDKIFYRDDEYCIKVFNENYSATDVLNEALNQARLYESGLNVPRLVEVTCIEGKWAIVYTYISGKTLSQLMEENPDKFDEYMQLFVNLQSEVSSQTLPLLNKNNDRLTRRINEADLDAVTRYDLQYRLDCMPKLNNVCHGDFDPSNIIFSEDGTPYIIDWSHASRGDAAADAARTYLMFRFTKDEETAEKYITLFCEKNDMSESDIKKWVPIIAAAESVTANEKDKKVLISIAKSVDYI